MQQVSVYVPSREDVRLLQDVTLPNGYCDEISRLTRICDRLSEFITPSPQLQLLSLQLELDVAVAKFRQAKSVKVGSLLKQLIVANGLADEDLVTQCTNQLVYLGKVTKNAEIRILETKIIHLINQDNVAEAS